MNHWDGKWIVQEDSTAPHEAQKLNLATDLAYHQLGWLPRWDFKTTVERTVQWYKNVLLAGASPLQCCLDDLIQYHIELGL